MNYLLYGLNDFIKKEEINIITKKYKIDSNSISYFNEENTVNNIIDDLKTFPLFGDYKLVIINNYLNNINKTDEELINKYINNSSKFTILVFDESVEKIDLKKKILKNIENKIECNKFNINKFVKEQLDGYQVRDSLINKIISRVGQEQANIQNELNKLKLYKINDKVINEEDLNILVKVVDDNIFNFIDSIINDKKEKMYEEYELLMNKNTEIISLISILSNQIRIMYQTSVLSHEGKNPDMIADILEIHPYRVKLALEKSFNYSENKMIDLLYKLSILDMNIKIGLIDPAGGFEMFLLKI